MSIKFYAVPVKTAASTPKVHFVWRGGETGISEGSDDCVPCSAGKLACGKSHLSELSATLRTMEGQKVGFCFSERSVDLRGTNKTK